MTMCTPVEEGGLNLLNNTGDILPDSYLAVSVNISYAEAGFYNGTVSADPYRYITELLSTKVRMLRKTSITLHYGTSVHMVVGGDCTIALWVN